MTSAQDAPSRVPSVLLAAIASVSLLSRGVGIMNIMLVSVTERTREIGMRIAVGARANDIFAQFLVEALALSLAGGLFGVGVGFGATYAISYTATGKSSSNRSRWWWPSDSSARWGSCSGCIQPSRPRASIPSKH